MANFSDELVNEAQAYLEKKTGTKPSKELTNEFLRNMASLGDLFLKNAKAILKQDKYPKVV